MDSAWGHVARLTDGAVKRSYSASVPCCSWTSRWVMLTRCMQKGSRCWGPSVPRNCSLIHGNLGAEYETTSANAHTYVFLRPCVCKVSEASLCSALYDAAPLSSASFSVLNALCLTAKLICRFAREYPFLVSRCHPVIRTFQTVSGSKMSSVTTSQAALRHNPQLC